MKIAFLNLYQTSVNRGMERYVSELSKRLSKNHEVKIIGIDTNFDKKIDWIKKDSSGTISRRFFIDYWSILVAKYTLFHLKEIANGKFDIVIPTNGGWQSLVIKILSLVKGFRVVIPGQSGIGWDDRINLLTFPDIFVALSSHAKKWARRANPLAKTVYIPNGVDLRLFYPDPYVKKDKKFKIILAVGAFTKQKRLDLVIKAAAPINNAKVLIAGATGELKKELTDLGNTLLGAERFEIQSALSMDKMPSIYKSADIFTLPSESSEAFGNVLVEAMASGLPVVATSDPIRGEIVGDAGILVDPSDIDRYTNALRSVLESDWNSKPRIQAEKFDWDKITVEYEKLFDQIIKVKK